MAGGMQATRTNNDCGVGASMGTCTQSRRLPVFWFSGASLFRMVLGGIDRQLRRFPEASSDVGQLPTTRMLP